MKSLLDKSGESYRSALLLLTKGLYCNSIQSAYYSCLQLAKHVVISNASHPEIIEHELNKGSSHTNIISRTIEELKKGEDTFAELMPWLKRARTNAVYETVDCDESIANEIVNKSETVIRLLKQN